MSLADHSISPRHILALIHFAIVGAIMCVITGGIGIYIARLKSS